MSNIIPFNSYVQPSETPSSFRDFARLPYELRDMIWDMAIPDEPRIIKVKRPTRAHIRENPLRLQPHATASCTIPTLLHTTKESRFRALKQYSLLFSENLDGELVYFNSEKDKLFMESPEAFNCFFDGNDDTNDVEMSLKHLVIDGELKGNHVERLKKLWTLKTLTISDLILNQVYVKGLLPFAWFAAAPWGRNLVPEIAFSVHRIIIKLQRAFVSKVKMGLS